MISHKTNEFNRPDVSIIIINWNVDKMLEQCITSVIQNSNDISYETVVIDNNSTGHGFKRVKQKFLEHENFTWIENDKNIGGLAENQALKYCQGRYLLLLGPDVIVLAQCIKRMVNFLDEKKEAGGVTAKLLNTDGSPQNYCFKLWNLTMVFFSIGFGKLLDKILFKGKFRRHYFEMDSDSKKITVVDQPSGACFMLRWNSVITGYLVDKNFPFYFNDADLCKRIYDNGYKIFLLPFAEVIHFQSSSFKKADNDWRIREFRLSAIKYFKKYHRNKVEFLRFIFLIEDISRYIFYKIIPTRLYGNSL